VGGHRRNLLLTIVPIPVIAIIPAVLSALTTAPTVTTSTAAAVLAVRTRVRRFRLVVLGCELIVLAIEKTPEGEVVTIAARQKGSRQKEGGHKREEGFCTGKRSAGEAGYRLMIPKISPNRGG
jgi:uncharacterized membrane protein YgcG